jgi:hypothetical protein
MKLAKIAAVTVPMVILGVLVASQAAANEVSIVAASAGCLSFAKTGSARLSVAIDLSGAGDVTNTMTGVSGRRCAAYLRLTPRALDVPRTKSTTSPQAARRS